jgi:hypothetical protein
MATLLAPLAPLAAAVGILFGHIATPHKAVHSRPARCAVVHGHKRCKSPVIRHATARVSKKARRKSAKHPAVPAPTRQAPTTLPVITTAPPVTPAPTPSPAPTPVTPPTLPSVPASLASPSISGTPAVGSTLQATLGSWLNSPTSYSYHWSECPGSCNGSNGSPIAGASGQLTYVPQAGDVGDTIYFVVTAGNAGGQATAYSASTADVTSAGAASGLLYDGTFSGSEANYPIIYGNCASMLSSSELEFDLTSSCNPAGDGHYRTDYSTPDVYPAGIAECTSVPFDMVNLPTVPVNSWFGFAEAKDPAANLAGWGFGVTSYYGGVNELQIEFNGYNNTAPAWTSTGGVPAGWNTLSICTNDANDSSGVVYGIWLNGVRQTFNHGSASGSESLSGFAIIDDGASSWPLDINDYTGGSPSNNEIIHGSPLVAAMSSNGLPPEPSGGWNSP